MIPENTDTPLKADCPSAPCSALEFLAQELDMPAEHIREAARAMRDERDNDTEAELAAWELLRDVRMEMAAIAEASNQLHEAFFVMRHDWKDGDFDLPPLARIHMEAMECKAIELGKLLFQQNAEVSGQPPSATHADTKKL